MSLILNLQHFSGDQNQAMELAKLIADLEDSPRDDVIFLFTARFDCMIDHQVVSYVRKKFPRTVFYKTVRKATGWPEGPNSMFAESYSHCVERIRDGTYKDVDGILFMEADCVPLAKDWINQLKGEWDRCKGNGKMVTGCWFEADDARTRHINGNMIIHKDLWMKNRQILTPMNGGWDVSIAPITMSNAIPSKLIYSDYHLGVAGYNEWKGCDDLWKIRTFAAKNNPLHGQELHPVWLHAPKDLRGIECVRAKLLPKSP